MFAYFFRKTFFSTQNFHIKYFEVFWVYSIPVIIICRNILLIFTRQVSIIYEIVDHVMDKFICMMFQQLLLSSSDI